MLEAFYDSLKTSSPAALVIISIALMLSCGFAMTRLTKTRYSFPFAGHTVEIDVYPHEIGGDALEGLAVMEIELESPDEAIEFPPFIRVIRELTGTREFSNKALARPVK